MDFISNISEIFALPASATVRKGLPKTFFKNNFELLSSEKKILEDNSVIESMEILALVNPKSANIPAVLNEEEPYEEIIFLLVKSTEKQLNNKKKEVADLIHKYIPNHLLLAIYDNNDMMLSIAEKRINQNEKSKRIIVQTYSTENISWAEPSESHQLFLEQLSFSKADTSNLMNYYRYFIQCFSGLLLEVNSGQFRIRTYERSKDEVEVLNQIELLKNEITTFENKAIKETQIYDRLVWNTKVNENRTKIKQLEKTLL